MVDEGVLGIEYSAVGHHCEDTVLELDRGLIQAFPKTITPCVCGRDGAFYQVKSRADD